MIISVLFGAFFGFPCLCTKNTHVAVVYKRVWHVTTIQVRRCQMNQEAMGRRAGNKCVGGAGEEKFWG